MKGLNIWRSLREGRWIEDLPPQLRQSALAAYGMRLVHSIKLAVLDEGIQVMAKVVARGQEDLEVRISLTGFSLEFFDTKCSCAVGRNCRHVYAALLAGVQLSYRPREDLPQPDLDENRYEVRPLWGPAAAAAVAVAAEGETSQLPVGSPSPVVRLFCEYPFTGYMGWYSGVPYGEQIRLLALEFTYQEAPGEGFEFGGGKMVFDTWRRDAAAERACFSRLEGLGLSRCGAVLSHALKAPLRDVLLFHPIDPVPWEELLMVHLPVLVTAGWKVRTEESFDLDILHPEYFYEDIAETGKADWFAADIGIESGGRRVPLLPLLVAFLKRQPAALDPDRLLEKGDAPVLIPLGDGRSMVPVPASRLHRILTSLAELFAGKPKLTEGRFSVHRLQAAAFLMGDGDGLLVQRTSDGLRSLVAHLRGGMEQVLEMAPAGLRAELRPYQLEGFRWLRSLGRHGLGGILADDMGLGKTLQTLAFLLAEVDSGAAAGRPGLIVCPTSVLQNWKDEALKFTPSLGVHIHYGSARAASLERCGKPDLIITSYPLLVRDTEVLAAMEFHLVVLDEAQFIKNPRTLAAVSAGRLQSRLRLCLTGTPMENHLGELWSIVNFLMPGYLGGWDDFTRIFRTPIEKQQDGRRREQLAKRMVPVMLRRTKQAVLTDLPPRIDLIHRIALPPEQADLYESVRAAMDARVREEIDKRGMERSHIAILDALLKLRQVCCHPSLLKLEAARKVTVGAKLDFFMELVPELIEEGRRILVFSQFVEMLDILSGRLKGAGVEHLMLTGQTKDRAALVARFQAGEVPLFLISLKAGGTGLNLTAADTVIHYDPWWNPAVEAQATDRAHRFGQQHTVFVHKLICEGTIEEKILALQVKKAALVAGLLAGDGAAARFSEEDLEGLLAPVGSWRGRAGVDIKR